MDQQPPAGSSAPQSDATKPAATKARKKTAGAGAQKAAAKPAAKRKAPAKTAAKAGGKSRGKATAATMQLQLIRSPIGRPPAHRRTVAALGLRRVGHTVEKRVDPAVLGMVQQVRYMLRVDGQTLADARRDAAGST